VGTGGTRRMTTSGRASSTLFTVVSYSCNFGSRYSERKLIKNKLKDPGFDTQVPGKLLKSLAVARLTEEPTAYYLPCRAKLIMLQL
jgi:hypothetical protein